ncbi:MAG TPA: hypothetical protein VHB21_25465 [Minicystis sp.]|nr:hypothetical protein [Minicystis sp.]
MRAACLRSVRPALLAAVAFGAACAWAPLGCSSGGSTSAAASTGGQGGGPCGLADADNAEWCAADAASLDCSTVTAATNDVCGVPIVAPSASGREPLARSTSTVEFAGDGPPEVSCFEQGHYPSKPGTSQMVKVKGLAKIFSSGCNSHDLRIEFYTVKRGGSDDGLIGSLVGSAVVTDPESVCQSSTGTAVSNKDCGTRYECPFEYDGVPTETELAIKTSGSPNWAPLYDYNIFIPNDEVQGGTWQHDVRALAADDYQVIPHAAYGGSITPGNGVIAGEVHDCGDVRLSGALVNVDQHNRGLYYFTSNEQAPLPDVNATQTSILGLYAAFDIQEGPVTVAAMGFVDNKPVTLGFYKAHIYPDSVTAVTFRGLEPFQVP